MNANESYSELDEIIDNFELNTGLTLSEENLSSLKEAYNSIYDYMDEDEALLIVEKILATISDSMSEE